MDLLQAWRDTLDGQGWSYGEVDEVPLLVIPVRSRTGAFVCYAEGRDEAGVACFYAVFPDEVPEGSRLAVVELLQRANQVLPVGGFLMVWDSGEVRFKAGIDVSEVGPSAALLGPLAHTAVGAMELYLPEIRAVARGSRTVAEALGRLRATARR